MLSKITFKRILSTLDFYPKKIVDFVKILKERK